jgi:adenylate cyclase
MGPPARENEPDEPAVLYNAACSYANVGDYEKALDCLERATTGDWGDPDWMEQDWDLATIRNEPRFQRLIERMRSRSSGDLRV